MSTIQKLTVAGPEHAVIKALAADLQTTRDRLALVRGRVAERQTIIKSQQRALVQLEARLAAIEAQPMPGGPVTRAVRGAAPGFVAEGDTVLKAFDTVAAVAKTEHERLELAQKKLAYLRHVG